MRSPRKKGPGRPTFYTERMTTDVRVRLTATQHRFLQAAAGAGLGNARSQADVLRFALDYLFTHHPEARTIGQPPIRRTKKR